MTYIVNMQFVRFQYNPEDKRNVPSVFPFHIWHYFHILIIYMH